jgi:hypothetical protein
MMLFFRRLQNLPVTYWYTDLILTKNEWLHSTTRASSHKSVSLDLFAEEGLAWAGFASGSYPVLRSKKWSGVGSVGCTELLLPYVWKKRITHTQSQITNGVVLYYVNSLLERVLLLLRSCLHCANCKEREACVSF